MRKIWIKITSILFFLLTLTAVLLFGMQNEAVEQELKESGSEKMQQFIRAMVIEWIPQYDYHEQSNTEFVYQWTKKLITSTVLPYWGYREQYGSNSEELISENTVPSFLYEENEETKNVDNTSDTIGHKFTEKQLYSQSYLRKYFLQVDSTTTITNQELNGKKLFQMNLKLENDKSPQILIYHTHGSEEYANSKSGKKSDTVLGVGDELTKELEKQGFSVLHDKTSYDIRNGKLDRSKAYYYAAKGIEQNLKKYPQIQVIIDLHRDGVASGTHLVTKIDGKKTAQVMFFNGMSRTATNGDIAYLKNPNKLWNLAMSLQMQKEAYEKYPGFTRKIYIKGYRYNLHYRKRSMLVEVGAQTNTVEEAKRAMKPLADIITSVLK
ncbi:MAG: stage II sporulation protein P [Lachnospiraceae bacterium]|nr:stage II sporulation protein P [Lachnospiraceae bacterium]